MYNHKEGVTFRKLGRADLSMLLELKKESWWGTHKSLIVNKEDQEKWFDNLSSRELFLVGEVENNPIGVAVYTDIDWISRTLSISGSALKEYRKYAENGFIGGLDFAFEMMNMHRVEAEILEYNYPSLKIELKTLGFKLEGRKRKSVFKVGKYYDSIIVGLLREEWEKQKRVISYKGSCCYNIDLGFVDKMIKRAERELF